MAQHPQVTSDVITLALKDGTGLDIPPKSVTSISYGQEAHRRVGTMVALAILVAPIALFGLFAKTRLHFICIQYTTADKKSAGILLQGDKDNCRAILVALQGVTGVPVSVAEKEREFVPVGVRTEVPRTEVARTDVPETEHPPQAPCTVAITSNPAGADIFIDDDFAGNTPSTLNVSAGKHVVMIRKPGLQEWTRKVSLSGGSITLNAELMRGTDEMHAATPVSMPDSRNESVAGTSTNSSPRLIGWIGVLAQNNGDIAVVTNVNADSPGAKAGIQIGDIILALDGRLIKGKDFEATVAALKPGTQISVSYARGSQN